MPPTLNLDSPGDPPEDFDCNYIPKLAQEHAVNVALTNSFGFGGQMLVCVWRSTDGLYRQF